jgi:hypothetical protein
MRATGEVRTRAIPMQERAQMARGSGECLGECLSYGRLRLAVFLSRATARLYAVEPVPTHRQKQKSGGDLIDSIDRTKNN